MANNFLQWNPGAINQENDAAYSGDAQRSGGATFGAIFQDVLGNKLFYQLSIFVAAFAAALTAKGYAPNDGSASPGTALATLQAILADVVTNADLDALVIVDAAQTLVTGGSGAKTIAVPAGFIGVGQLAKISAGVRCTVAPSAGNGPPITLTVAGGLLFSGSQPKLAAIGDTAKIDCDLAYQTFGSGGLQAYAVQNLIISGNPQAFVGQANPFGNPAPGFNISVGVDTHSGGGQYVIDYLSIKIVG